MGERGTTSDERGTQNDEDGLRRLYNSGAVGMPLLPFFFGGAIGRGKRVFLVAGAIRLGGEKAEATLRRHIEPVGWGACVLLVGLVGWMFVRHGA